MKFGVFDHMDDAGVPLAQLYGDRLRIVEAYDRSGFFGYHVAEHHSTPLGCAASPGLFLAAVAQRTRQLRFGPLVYLLPFYHPLRLIEEICMLDHMSGGRLQLGIGRGVSPFETAAFGLDFSQTAEMYHEAFALVLKGLANDELTFEGKYYQYRNVPIVLKPLQRPHPPLWYGTGIVDNADWPAANDVNIVSIGLRATVRAISQRYHAKRAALGKPAAGPLVGVTRHVVVAESEEAALRIARRAYPRWRKSFNWLWERHGIQARIAALYPPTFDELAALDNGVAGTPAQVRDFLAAEADASQVNYLLGWFAFGDMTVGESLRSIELFAREVMPALTEASTVAAQ